MNARCAARVLLAALVSASAPLGFGRAAPAVQAPNDDRPRLGEGPLDNNAFLPTHEGATAALALADRRCVELAGRALDDATRRAWLEALDALHVALRESSVGDMVAPLPQSGGGIARAAWPDRDGTSDPKLDRRRDGVEVSVLRRLALLTPELRALWRERFQAAAETALAQAGRDTTSLARVERDFPATRPAFAAALALADAALERGAPAAADAWLERASLHADLAELEELARSLDVRHGAVEVELAAVATRGEQGWRDATSIRAIGAVAIDPAPRETIEPGLGVRPGLCFLEGQRAAVQVAGARNASSREGGDRLTLIDLRDAQRIAVVAPARLLEPLGVSVGWLDRPVEPPGWPLLPASDGRGVVLTLGRRGWERGNALACVDFVETPGSAEPPSAALRWAWYDGRAIAGAGLSLDAEPPSWTAVEFQPGAVIADGVVYVAAREFALPAEDDGTAQARANSNTEITTWLVALDLASGALRWRTRLGKGVEIQRSRGRFFAPVLPTSSAQPLAAADGHLFVGSHTGFGSLVDALDGRVDFGFRNRRRNSERRTWTGGRPPVDGAGSAILWAPADSDHVYWLRARPDLDGAGVSLQTPRSIGEGEILIGGDRDTALVLSRAGAERALTGWDAAGGRTYAAPELGPSETFGGEGLASASRAWFASTRGLYLADLSRELFLLDYARLDPPPGAPTLRGGAVFAHGEIVCVVSPTTAWVFEALR